MRRNVGFGVTNWGLIINLIEIDRRLMFQKGLDIWVGIGYSLGKMKLIKEQSGNEFW